jgi:hypothetical protein
MYGFCRSANASRTNRRTVLDKTVVDIARRKTEPPDSVVYGRVEEQEMSMTPDKRIEWCRENIPGFKAMHDQAEKARLDTEENRKRMAGYMSAANLQRFPVKQERAA